MLPLLRRAWAAAAASRRGTRRCSLGACCSYRLRDARECRRPPAPPPSGGSRFPQGGSARGRAPSGRGCPHPLGASSSRRLRRAGRCPEPPSLSPPRGSPAAHRALPGRPSARPRGLGWGSAHGPPWLPAPSRSEGAAGASRVCVEEARTPSSAWLCP